MGYAYAEGPTNVNDMLMLLLAARAEGVSMDPRPMLFVMGFVVFIVVLMYFGEINKKP